MAMGTWILRVGGHDPLLDGEDQVMRRVEGGRREGWVAAAEPDLQGSDGFAQTDGHLVLVPEAEILDFVQQIVGLGEEQTPARVGGGGHARTIGRDLRACQVSLYTSGNAE
jgi:hypothetical protein